MGIGCAVGGSGRCSDADIDNIDAHHRRMFFCRLADRAKTDMSLKIHNPLLVGWIDRRLEPAGFPHFRLSSTQPRVKRAGFYDRNLTSY